MRRGIHLGHAPRRLRCPLQWCAGHHPCASLVPSNLVHIVMGQEVPADVKLINTSGHLKFDRSAHQRSMSGIHPHPTRVPSVLC